MSISPMPWTSKDGQLFDANGKHVFSGFVAKYDYQAAASTEDCDMVAACVNACQGLSANELINNGLVGAVGYELLRQDQKIKQLIQALHDVSAKCELGSDICHAHESIAGAFKKIGEFSENAIKSCEAHNG